MEAMAQRSRARIWCDVCAQRALCARTWTTCVQKRAQICAPHLTADLAQIQFPCLSLVLLWPLRVSCVVNHQRNDRYLVVYRSGRRARARSTRTLRFRLHTHTHTHTWQRRLLIISRCKSYYNDGARVLLLLHLSKDTRTCADHLHTI